MHMHISFDSRVRAKIAYLLTDGVLMMLGALTHTVFPLAFIVINIGEFDSVFQNCTILQVTFKIRTNWFAKPKTGLEPLCMDPSTYKFSFKRMRKKTFLQYLFLFCLVILI